MNCITRRLLSVAKTRLRPNLFNIGLRHEVTTSKLEQLIRGIPDDRINDRDGRGWTALMIAAREGEVGAVNLLLEKGAKSNLQTGSGHTAYDVAIFWQKEECAKILRPAVTGHIYTEYFSYDGFNHNSSRRSDEDWIRNAVIQDNTEFVMMHKAKPLVFYEENLSPKAKLNTNPRLFVKHYADVHHIISDSFDNLLYIGQWEIDHSRTRKKGDDIVERNIFGIDVSHLNLDEVKDLYPGVDVLPPFPGLLRLTTSEATIAAQAHSILNWQYRYRFCPSCGSETRLADAGNKRICNNKSCSTNTSRGKSSTCYPRVDPTVISSVTTRDNMYSLLARQKGFPPGMYSCLAGFVEPGESMEQACRREVHEEVGILVSHVQYHSSQAWPMPCSLMLGCTSSADHRPDIQFDRVELEDARWFTRMDVVLMMMHHHPEGFFIPPRQALAHRLLHDWITQTAFPS